MRQVAKHLDNIIYLLVLTCLVVVSFAFTTDRYHPFDAIKQLLFHFFVLLAFFLLVVRSILTSTFPVKKSLLHTLILLYLCYNALSFALSPHPDQVYFVNLTFLILFFFVAAASVNSRSRYDYLLNTIAFLVVASSIYSFFQFFGYDYYRFVGNLFGERPLGSRVFSFYGNPNLFAAFLVVNFPLVLSGFLVQRGGARYLCGTATILAIPALMMTGTRAAIPGFGISTFLFLVITLGRADRKRYILAICITVMVVMAGFLYTAKATETGIARLELRQYWWQNAFQIMQDHPVFGTGVGSFNVYYPAYRKKSIEIALGQSQHERRLEHAHNEFLEILSDLGILGFLLFAGILFVFFARYYLSWDPKKKYLFAGNCCAVMGILIHSLYSVNLRFFFIAMFLWLSLALQSALLSTPRTEEKATLNAGKVIASLLPLPLLTMFFLGYSLKRFSVEYYLKEGLGFWKTANYGVAETYFKKALENNPQEKWALYYLGISQYRLEKLPESKENLRQLIKLDPNFVQVHYWLANNYFRALDFERAKEEYQESLRVNDAYGPSYYALGLISLTENDIQQSLDYLERAYALEGDGTTRYIRIRALEKLIEINQKLGNTQEATTYAEKLRELAR